MTKQETTQKINQVIEKANFKLYSIEYLDQIAAVYKNTARHMAKNNKIARVTILRGNKVYTASVSSNLTLSKSVYAGTLS